MAVKYFFEIEVLRDKIGEACVRRALVVTATITAPARRTAHSRWTIVQTMPLPAPDAHEAAPVPVAAADQRTRQRTTNGKRTNQYTRRETTQTATPTQISALFRDTEVHGEQTPHTVRPQHVTHRSSCGAAQSFGHSQYAFLPKKYNHLERFHKT